MVGQLQRRRTVGDDDRGDVAIVRAQRIEDEGFRAGIDGRRRVVEDEDARAGQQRAGKGDALALAAGQRVAAFADGGVPAIGKLVDEGDLGVGGGAFDVGVGGLRVGQCDVVAQGAGAQEGLVGHDGDGVADVVGGGQGDVDGSGVGSAHTDDLDGTGIGHVMAPEQLGEDGLARPRGTHQRQGGTGGEVDGDVVKQSAPAPRMRHPAKAQAHRPRGDGEGIGGIGMVGQGLDDLADAVDARGRQLQRNEHRGDHARQRRQRGQVRGEGDERAHRDPALQRQPPADGDVGHQRHLRQRLQCRLETCVELRRAHPQGVEAAGE